MANAFSSFTKFLARLTPAAALLAGGVVSAFAQPATLLRDVRFWSSTDTTRIAIETTQDADFHHGTIEHPDRLYIDLVDVQPRSTFKGLAYTIPVNDGLVKQIRVAPNRASVTRVVLDLTGPVEVTTGKLVNPPRIVIDVRRVAGAAPVLPPPVAPAPEPPPAVAPQAQPQQPQQQPPISISNQKPPSSPTPASSRPPQQQQASAAAAASSPSTSSTRIVKLEAPPPPSVKAKSPAAATAPPEVVEEPALAFAAPARPVAPPMVIAKSNPMLAAKPEPSLGSMNARLLEPPAPVAPPPSMLGRSAEAARLETPSLTRALGLKLHRVVLDAGHGGIDPGSDGPTGLVEKELLLDITLRLGRLLQERSGIEVLYTRKDDSFVDLHERAPFANRAKADLFLSIHANTAPVRSVVGAETYYLNRGESKEDLAVATRENATSVKGISELGDLVKKIVAYDKRDESRQFATHIQSATQQLSVQTFGHLYNRGVRHAPFAVLIGATMPAVLVEVGFISNPREEALLKKSEHRQKVAEALYKGIMSYSQTLSHFTTLAKAED